jgi:hypothetical protein
MKIIFAVVLPASYPSHSLVSYYSLENVKATARSDKNNTYIPINAACKKLNGMA